MDKHCPRAQPRPLQQQKGPLQVPDFKVYLRPFRCQVFTRYTSPKHSWQDTCKNKLFKAWCKGTSSLFCQELAPRTAPCFWNCNERTFAWFSLVEVVMLTQRCNVAVWHKSKKELRWCMAPHLLVWRPQHCKQATWPLLMLASLHQQEVFSSLCVL